MDPLNLSNRFSIDQLVTCAKRELNQRKRVYSRLVNNGKMNPETAEREIAMMAAILENLSNQIARLL